MTNIEDETEETEAIAALKKEIAGLELRLTIARDEALEDAAREVLKPGEHGRMGVVDDESYSVELAKRIRALKENEND